LNEPTELVVDVAGNIFFSDGGNNVIRKVNTSGIISTIAGNGVSGYSGDGFAATAAQLATPHGVTLDLSGNLIVADAYNNRIRKISHVSTFSGCIQAAQHILRIFPNPNNGTFYISGTLPSSSTDDITVEISNTLGQTVYCRTEKTQTCEVNMKVNFNVFLPESIYIALVTIGTERYMYTILKNR
jgi:Secretion system C-terminal sorting domain/NHL repeat